MTDCPACGYHIELATEVFQDGRLKDIGKGAPKPGDYSLCVRCSQFLVFTDEKMGTRKMTESEFESLNERTKRTLMEMRSTFEAAKMMREMRDTRCT